MAFELLYNYYIMNYYIFVKVKYIDENKVCTV